MIRNDIEMNYKKYQTFCDLGVSVLVTIEIFFFFTPSRGDLSIYSF